MERRSLILDAGAVLALARGDTRARGLFQQALEQKARIIVPPIVVTQIIRGGPGDARVHRILNAVQTSFVGKRLAMAAGALLAETGPRDAADAQVMAEALRSAPSLLLTSDPDDMALLAGGRTHVRVISI